MNKLLNKKTKMSSTAETGKIYNISANNFTIEESKPL